MVDVVCGVVATALSAGQVAEQNRVWRVLIKHGSWITCNWFDVVLCLMLPEFQFSAFFASDHII